MMVTGVTKAADVADNAVTAMARTVAVQEIEYLRRLYARATDRIGENTSVSIADGRATYHRIFTADVIFRLKGEGIPASDTVGPDAWVDVVIDALGVDYKDTQHLIGTQLVDIESIEIDQTGRVTAGEATMSSYLQAWHASPDDDVWLFLGTYRDKVRYTPNAGWQIYDTTLERVSGEERPMGSAG
jgi:hypothetical protein